jgi:hypothetical protein
MGFINEFDVGEVVLLWSLSNVTQGEDLQVAGLSQHPIIEVLDAVVSQVEVGQFGKRTLSVGSKISDQVAFEGEQLQGRPIACFYAFQILNLVSI